MMKTKMAGTSLEAFHSFDPAHLQNKELEIMKLFMKQQCALTREVIAETLGWKEGAVCGRVNALVEKKWLQEIDGGRTRSGRPAKLVRLPPAPVGQLELMQ